MAFSKISNKSSTVLPHVETRRRKRSTPHGGKVTISSHHLSVSNEHLPPINRTNFLNPTDNDNGEDVHELMKKYDGLLNEHMENEVLIEHKKNEIEKQKREIENLLEHAEEEREYVKKVTKEYADAMIKLKDIERENVRMKFRKSEQKLEMNHLKGKNKEMRNELRSLTNKITETQNRIEHKFIKGEIERYQREASELEEINEAMDIEVKLKATQLNELKIEMLMKDNARNESYDENVKSDEDNKTPKPCKSIVKSYSMLPAISGTDINNQSTSASERSRNILHRGTSVCTAKNLLPHPPTSGLPPNAHRRHRYRRS